MGSSLLSTLLLLLAAVLLARISSVRLARWAVPAIVLELLVGFVLGNSVLAYERIAPLAGLTELGVLSLFFQVGLEARGSLLGSRPAAVLRTVLLSAFVPLLLWWPLQQTFALTAPTTLLWLAVLSATGTGVTLRALAQAGALQTPSGRVLVGVSVLDDLPAIGLLTVSMLLGTRSPTAGGWAVTAPLLGLGLMGLTLVLCHRWRRRHGPWRPQLLEVLIVLICSSWLGELCGLTSLLGALWGGVLLTRLASLADDGPELPRLQAQLSLLSDVFLPLYFISVGITVQVSSLLHPEAWRMALVLLLLAIGSKVLCGFGISAADRAAGVDRRLIVYGLIPRGLPGLVFASTALAGGLITPAQYAALVLMVSATTVLGLLLLARRLSPST